MNENFLKENIMYYYEVTIKYTSGKVSVTNCEPLEVNDTKAYCNEGISGGWIESYEIKAIEEEY